MIRCGRMWPYETTTDTSGSSAPSSARNRSPRGLSGCSSGRPSPTATSLIGEGTSEDRERPCARSGCVTTPTTSNPSPNSALSDGTANVDVPQKRTRTSKLLVPPMTARGFLRRQLADVRAIAVLLPRLLPLRERGAALHETQVIDEQPAVQMVDLVLQTPREQVVGVHLERFPVAILRPDDHAHRALDVSVNVGNRQAAFFAFLLAFGVDDLGIDHDERILVDVDHGQAFGASHLRRRETDALGGVHRLEHVVDQALELRCDLLHRHRLLSQDRLSLDVNLQQAHHPLLPLSAALLETRAMRPRATMMRDSADLMEVPSTIEGAAAPSFVLTFMKITSPTIPPAVTTSSPFLRARSASSCCLRCFCCGLMKKK